MFPAASPKITAAKKAAPDRLCLLSCTYVQPQDRPEIFLGFVDTFRHPMQYDISGTKYHPANHLKDD